MSNLLNNFYEINNIENIESGNYLVQITLNPNHVIFEGHFPGQPVAPGVCMMQIVKEICEDITSKKLFLSSASNIKFLSIIDPSKNPLVAFNIDISEINASLKVKTSAKFGETIALKMSLNYNIVS